MNTAYGLRPMPVYGTLETCAEIMSVKYIDGMPQMKGKWSDVAGERMN